MPRSWWDSGDTSKAILTFPDGSVSRAGTSSRGHVAEPVEVGAEDAVVVAAPCDLGGDRRRRHRERDPAFVLAGGGRDRDRDGRLPARGQPHAADDLAAGPRDHRLRPEEEA